MHSTQLRTVCRWLVVTVLFSRLPLSVFAQTPAAETPADVDSAVREQFQQLLDQRDPWVDKLNAAETVDEALAAREKMLEFDRQLAELAAARFPDDESTRRLLYERVVDNLNWIADQRVMANKIQDAADLHGERAEFAAKYFGEEDFRVRGSWVKQAGFRELAAKEQQLQDQFVAAQQAMVKSVKLLNEGDVEAARPLAEQALADLKASVGDAHYDVGVALNNLALLAERKHDHEEAVEFYSQSADVLRAALGVHPTTSNTLHNFALLYLNHGDYDTAEPLLTEAAQMREATLGSDDLSTADCYYGLGLIAFNTGRFEEAVGHFDRYGRTMIEKVGENDSRVANALSYIGRSLLELGNVEGALNTLQGSFMTRLELLGNEHVDTAAAAFYLGDALHRTGQSADAVKYYQQALTIVRKAMPGDNAFLGVILNNLGVEYSELKQYDQAIETLNEAIRVREAVFGRKHDTVAHTLWQLAAALRDNSQFDKALEAARESAAIFEETQGADSATVVDVTYIVASIHHLADDYDQAEPLYQQVIQLRKTAGNLAGALIAQQSLANMYRAADRLDDAIEQMSAAYEAAYEAAPDASLTAELATALADLYVRNGQQDKADQLLAPLRAAADGQIAANNLKMLALGLMNYESSHKTFPAAGSEQPGGASQLSWRVHILPYLEQQQLYDRFRLDEPWDSEHNKALIAEMPEVFTAPGVELPAGKTVYLAVTGPGTFFGDGSQGTSIREITDGSSNTVMLVEADADKAVEWTRPSDYQYDPAAEHRGLGSLRDGSFYVAMADGYVQALPADLPQETFTSLLTKAGGEVIEMP